MEKVKRNKNVIVAAAVALIVIVLLAAAIVCYFVLFKNAKDSTPNTTSNPNDTSNRTVTDSKGNEIGAGPTDFLFFEKAGDIERITLQYNDDWFIKISLAQNATIKENKNGTLEIVADGDYHFTVDPNELTVSVTVPSENITATLESRQKAFNLTNSTNSYFIDYTTEPIRLRPNDSNSATISRRDNTIAIESQQLSMVITEDDPAEIVRTVPNGAEFKIITNPASTVYERRDEQDLRIVTTVDEKVFETRFTPKNLSLMVASSDGDSLRFTVNVTVSIDTNGTSWLAMPFGAEKFAQILDGGETLNVSLSPATRNEFDRISLFDANLSLELSAKNDTVLLKNTVGDAMRLDGGQNVTVTTPSGNATADLFNAIIHMDGVMKFNSIAFNSEFWQGPVGYAENNDDFVKIFTKVGSILAKKILTGLDTFNDKLRIDILFELGEILLSKDDAWWYGRVLNMKRLGQLKLTSTEMHFLSAVGATRELNVKWDAQDFFTMKRCPLDGENCNIVDSLLEMNVEESPFRAMFMTNEGDFRVKTPAFVAQIQRETDTWLGGPWGKVKISPINK